MPVKAESVGINTRKQGAVPLQTLVRLDSADSAPSSDFAASLQKWHEKNKPARAISTRQADKAVPKGAPPRNPSIKTPRAAEGHVLEKQRSSQLARVKSCASPSDLYKREKKTTATLSPYPSIGLTKSSAPLQSRQPSEYTGRVLVQKQPSMTSPNTSIQKQPSLKTPRRPIQDRQPPWRQASGDEKPRPCVTRSMQRKLHSQQGSLPKVREHAANATEQRVPAAAMLGDSACTALGEACTSSSDIQQPVYMPGGLASKNLDKVADQGAGPDKVESKDEDLGVAADRLDHAATAEHGAAWTSKVAAKVSSIEPLPPETHAQPAVEVIIRPVPHNGGSAKSTAADRSPEHSALDNTPRIQGFRLPWNIEAGSSLPQRGSVRSPRLSKEGTLGHIDPKALVTKRLPRIKIRYHSGERPQAKPGRSWVFGCFHTPQTTSS